METSVIKRDWGEDVFDIIARIEQANPRLAHARRTHALEATFGKRKAAAMRRDAERRSRCLKDET